MKTELFTACTEDELSQLFVALKFIGDAINLPMFDSREEEIQDRDIDIMIREGIDPSALKNIKITIEAEDNDA